jgi:predicted metalloprotease with PDZ domain
MQATQLGQTLKIQQLDKCTWQTNCKANQALQLQYKVYAHDNSVRTAWLDANRGFFNGTSVCLRVEGQENKLHALEISAPKALPGWSLATGLTPHKVSKSGFGSYHAESYDALVDAPVEMGAFWSGSFKACGVPHRFVVAGAAPSFDGDKLLADAQKICETQIRFWHGTQKPPYKNYLFMLNAVDDGYGGLEHGNSTALICNRRDLPRLGDKKVSDG